MAAEPFIDGLQSSLFISVFEKDSSGSIGKGPSGSIYGASYLLYPDRTTGNGDSSIPRLGAADSHPTSLFSGGGAGRLFDGLHTTFRFVLKVRHQFGLFLL